jgi:hypothetical protein
VLSPEVEAKILDCASSKGGMWAKTPSYLFFLPPKLRILEKFLPKSFI